MLAKKYFNEIHRILYDAYDTQVDVIRKCSETIVDTSIRHNTIYAFGCNHSGLLSQEMFYRTGGLVTINPILIPGLALDSKPITLTTGMERLEGFGKIIIENSNLRRGDLLIVHSVSGRNNVPIDMAIYARELGVTVIGLTNVQYSSQVSSRHPSSKKLFEVCDIVVDNCGCFGDAAIEVEGFLEKIAPSSTVVGAALLNAIVAEAIEIFIDKEITPPIFISSNVDGGDEHNKRVLSDYKDNIYYI